MSAAPSATPPARPSCASPATPRITQKEACGLHEGRSPSTPPSRSTPRCRSATCPRRDRVGQRRGHRRGHRPHGGDPAQAAPHLRAAPGRRRRGRDRPRHHRLRRQDRWRGLRRRQGRRLPVHHRRRPDAGAVRQGRARHEGRRIEDLPAAVPGRLSRPGRGRQGSRLPRQCHQDRGAEAARGGRGLCQGAGHRGRHRAGPARQRQEEPGARGAHARAGAQQGGGDGRAGRPRRSWSCPRRWWAASSSA